MRQAEGMGRASSSLFEKCTVERDASRLGEVVAQKKKIQSDSSPILSGAQWNARKRWSPSVNLLVPAVTYRRTSVPEAKKEEQEQEVVLSRPSSSATTTVVVANGDPPFRKVTRPAVRSKVVYHCYGADRFTTSAPLSDIAG
ncbi:hypothetical protein A4A49_63655 [Nicotiana attenuata]|uniref:Uncharacterized protein n=1 Tax=Nicotiana attenuata TaxID=49451 RepID=A0A314L784_NICAT|nr:hypothetical protein A4A49_63655 [Nicotiana attenuata]